MGETMPFPRLPEELARQASGTLIDGEPHEHWIAKNDFERTHVWVSAKTSLPRRLTNDALVEGAFVPLMTYDVLDLEAVAPAEDAFALDGSWTHDGCKRHVGGWPYMHLFHHYLMV